MASALAHALPHSGALFAMLDGDLNSWYKMWTNKLDLLILETAGNNLNQFGNTGNSKYSTETANG